MNFRGFFHKKGFHSCFNPGIFPVNPQNLAITDILLIRLTDSGDFTKLTSVAVWNYLEHIKVGKPLKNIILSLPQKVNCNNLCFLILSDKDTSKVFDCLPIIKINIINFLLKCVALLTWVLGNYWVLVIHMSYELGKGIDFSVLPLQLSWFHNTNR